MAWIAGNRFLSLDEMKNNADIIAQRFRIYGWSDNAIAAMLGNMQTESTINPGIWESLQPAPGAGYGLVGWTPYTKYSEWAGSDWATDHFKQLERIKYEVDSNLQWFANPEVVPANPPITFQQFTVSTAPVDTLANYFLWYYEHPANPNQPIRAIQARQWLEYIQRVRPVDDTFLILKKRRRQTPYV